MRLESPVTLTNPHIHHTLPTVSISVSLLPTSTCAPSHPTKILPRLPNTALQTLFSPQDKLRHRRILHRQGPTLQPRHERLRLQPIQPHPAAPQRQTHPPRQRPRLVLHQPSWAGPGRRVRHRRRRRRMGGFGRRPGGLRARVLRLHGVCGAHAWRRGEG